MELYVVEGEDLSKLPQNQQVEIQHVSEQNIEDYLKFINTLLNRLRIICHCKCTTYKSLL